MDRSVRERFSSPFSPLELSSAAADDLKSLAELFVATSVRGYEQFLLEENGVVDETRWKPMHRKDNVRSYAERRAVDAQSTTEDLPVVMVTGSIDGDLDDTIYGLVCPTIDAMRLKTSYVNDTLVRGCVLATLVAPTPSDPYRSLTVKWMEKGQRAHVRAVISNRDFVYMESTGVEYLRNGERVGYHLVHSVQFPETPPRDATIRGNMSICAVYRQKDVATTDVFLKGFLNPAGGIVRSIITRSAARALVSVSRNVHCARMKKLMWSIRRRGKASMAIDSEEPALSSVAEPCPTCAKMPSRLTKLRAAATGSGTTKRKRCKLCRRPVCSACRVDRKLSFLLQDRRLVQQLCVFCFECEQETTGVPAHDVARVEILDDDLHKWQDTYASSSGQEFTFVDELN